MFWTVLNKKITYQSLWDIDKAIVRVKCVALNVMLEKQKDLKSIT